MIAESEHPRPAWFVGAAFGGNNDQTERFVQEGIWEGGPEETYGHLIESIQPGDRIAIKSVYTRKSREGLPFDNRGEWVSVMAIKATGIVVQNIGNRRRVRVKWNPIDQPREWYFHTFRRTILAVYPDAWWRQGLMRFTFDGKVQDIDQTLRDPYFGDRYGYPELPVEEPAEATPNYDIDNIIFDGCFLDRATLESMLQGLQTKRNMILQGPPGTGKTWLAKKVAYALIGQKHEDRVRQVQFHPTCPTRTLCAVGGLKSTANSGWWTDPSCNWLKWPARTRTAPTSW